jgi:hypothetical protein
MLVTVLMDKTTDIDLLGTNFIRRKLLSSETEKTETKVNLANNGGCEPLYSARQNICHKQPFRSPASYHF